MRDDFGGVWGLDIENGINLIGSCGWGGGV
uniref:Speckle-type POZ family protein n=1 Tax=Rhizophora mucronata TaxID=61149 RepID=A0A2P2L2J0_RHIMU